MSPAGAVINTLTGFSGPGGLAFDSAGNLFVANSFNNTVSEVSPTGAIINTLSGFDHPVGLAFDPAGNLYVANMDNNTVSEVTPAGVVINSFSGFDNPGGLAFDSTGNLYVINSGNDTVSEVTPAGVVSRFFSESNVPFDLAFGAGNLYLVSAGDDTVKKISETVTVPFSLGGTAVAGTAYSSVTASPLTFVIGQTTQYITGTLLSDPGPNQTLILTLGTPTGGTALGSPSVNTLTIDETAVGTTTSTSTGSAVPLFLGEQRVFSGKGRHKKLVGFEFLFNGGARSNRRPIDRQLSCDPKAGQEGQGAPGQVALYSPSNFSVTISVAGFNTAKPTQVTITGLEGADDGAAIPQVVSRL